jgi:hypothetical protein
LLTEENDDEGKIFKILKKTKNKKRTILNKIAFWEQSGA